MMDDLFFTDPVECPYCKKVNEAGSMIWNNGVMLCPECWEKLKTGGNENSDV